MQRISFSPNREIRLFDKACRVESVLDQEIVVVWESGARSTYSYQTMLSHLYSGNLKNAPQSRTKSGGGTTRPPRRVSALLMDLSNKQREAAKLRFQLLRAIGDDVPIRRGDQQMQAFVAETAKSIGFDPAPSLQALIRWRRNLRRGGNDPQSLAPRFDRRGGKGKLRFEAAVRQEIDAVIQNYFLVPDNTSARAAHQILIAQLHKANQWRGNHEQLSIPSYSTFKRRIEQYDAYEVAASREGAKAAELKFRQSRINTEKYGINECWEVDHCRMDILIVDPESMQVIARPWLTTFIDHRTRAIMGFHISLGGTPTQAVLNCLAHAIRPKTYIKKQYPEIKGEWPCCGMPQIIKCDNGSEFHAATLKAAGLELGIEFVFCPVKKPWFKARIERFFGTLGRGLLHTLPGTTRHCTKARNDVGNANLPVIDLKLLNRMLHIWIIDEYMVGNNRGIQ